MNKTTILQILRDALVGQWAAYGDNAFEQVADVEIGPNPQGGAYATLTRADGNAFCAVAVDEAFSVSDSPSATHEQIAAHDVRRPTVVFGDRYGGSLVTNLEDCGDGHWNLALLDGAGVWRELRHMPASLFRPVTSEHRRAYAGVVE